MGLRINNNIAALNSYNNVNRTDKAVSSSLEKLSSGYRINKAADDAAGLVISEGLRSQIGGLTVAARNAQDGVSVAQTADGALGTVTSILQRMRDLSVQMANDSNSDDSRDAAQTELSSLSDELDRIAEATTFNGEKLLSGTFTNKTFQVGAGNDLNADRITMNIAATGASAANATFSTAAGITASTDIVLTQGGSVTTIDGSTLTTSSDAADIAKQLNAHADFKSNYKASVTSDGYLKIESKTGNATAVTVTSGITGTAASNAAAAAAGAFDSASLLPSVDISTKAGAQSAIDTIDSALTKVSAARAEVGAAQNRFEYAINNINVSIENLTASESAIRDTDMAAEMTKFTKNQILSQAGTSMLAQANSSTQNILTLLRG
ncbi:flagellin N-terminal helical domain-containing protein [Kineococcus sp. SYSU DK003]|uniref:flagellin N-terminal helical domain-containing protein n=1 Tax=Kineococcus sp. SYSU DK003 TaxID=3383124 RepID=UPI003D7C9C8F